MDNYSYITLREKPDLKETAANWFHGKFSVPTEAYLKCMEEYLSEKTEYGWYLCLAGDKIIGGMGVIENDFHDRKDLFPNVCAVYTEPEYRCKGIAGRLLKMVIEDLRIKGISPSGPVPFCQCGLPAGRFLPPGIRGASEAPGLRFREGQKVPLPLPARRS